MVEFCKKLLICICIMLVISNFMVNTLTFAADLESQYRGSMQESDSSIGDKLTDVLSGIVGLLTWFPRVMIIGGTSIIQVVGLGVGNMAGKVGTSDIGLTLSPDDVIFNKLNLTSIDFFDITTLPTDNVVRLIREQIALWYYIMRTIAIAILLGILIFVGIRMAITTIASEKAIYKKALFDWATSLALVFLLHYIIRAVLWLNTSLVEIFKNIAANMDLDDILNMLRSLAFDVDFTAGWGAVIVYIIITVQSLMFLISYIKRMLVIAFLIIISPLITITYSIDKMGDQKAQALNTWLKEFVFNVLIQPFHCILYLAFVSMAIKALNSKASIGAMLLACLCIKFVWDGEKIVRKIFGFEQASSLAAAAASGAVVGSMLNKAASAGKTAAGGIKYAKNSKTGQLMKQKWSQHKELSGLSHQAKKTYREEKKNGASAERLAAIKSNADNQNALRRTAKKVSNGINESPIGIVSRMATADARERVSKSKVAEKARKIKGVASTVANSDFAKAIGSDAKRFVRNIAQPEKLAGVIGGIMVGAGTLGLPDSNIFTASATGFATAKHAESKVREMRTRKKENYEEQLSKAWETQCNIDGTDKTDKNAFKAWASKMNSEGKLDMYSQKNVGKQESDASKSLGEAGLTPSQISTIIAEIKRAILSGQGYDPKTIEGKLPDGFDPSSLNKFAEMYNNQIIYGKTDAYDTQMEPLGYSHEDVVEEMNFSSSNTETTELEKILEKYGETDAEDVDSKITTELDQVKKDLENAISKSGVDFAGEIDMEKITSRLEGAMQSAMNDGVVKLESVVKSTLKQIQPDVTPTKEVIKEITTHIKEKHTLERDREIIRSR